MNPDVSIVIAAYNTRTYLERCLVALGDEHEVIVVDTGSTDGSQKLVHEKFPHVRRLDLEVNLGYGGALNAGVAIASNEFLVLMNGDAWPMPGGVERLVEGAARQPDAGVLGPRLLNPDGSLQPSVRGFPTIWRLATEYLFLRWLAPRSGALNAFYGSGFDHTIPREADFLLGAVLLVRRHLFDEIGGFDESFFMFNEEVDLCYRARAAGSTILFWPDAEFVHVGGASTAQVWPEMYREQLRSHLRFLAKHHGLREAERGRRLLVTAMCVRALVLAIVRRPERRSLSLEAARWLSSDDAAVLLDPVAYPRG
jgi:N-acetylglucosaminyl-diphospho-decaprenol L-rhamnosyltransferase